MDPSESQCPSEGTITPQFDIKFIFADFLSLEKWGEARPDTVRYLLCIKQACA